MRRLLIMFMTEKLVFSLSRCVLATPSRKHGHCIENGFGNIGGSLYILLGFLTLPAILTLTLYVLLVITLLYT